MSGLQKKPEERKFGRQLSTNNGEAAGQQPMLQVAPDVKAKINVSVPICV